LSAYAIRYTDRAAELKHALPAAQRASLEELEGKLRVCPFDHGARSNRDNSWSAFFTGGMITYVVSNRHLVINVINLINM
jgi:hypothetical protein